MRKVDIKEMNSRDLIDLACFYAMTNKPAAIVLALRAKTEFKAGTDDPVIVDASEALIAALQAF